MLGDARHSFDLVTLALLTGTDVEAVAADIRGTDARINRAEQELRSELVVHVTVRGADLHRLGPRPHPAPQEIERVGDQAKNILDLAEGGVLLADQPDTEMMTDRACDGVGAVRRSRGVVGECRRDPDRGLRRTGQRARRCHPGQDRRVHALRTAGARSRARAIYYRYLKRIVANLIGIVRTSSDPIQFADYLEEGTVDTDD